MPKRTSTLRNDSPLEDLNQCPSEALNSGLPPPIQKRPIYHSLGLANATVIVGGTILSLAALAFLVFLWAGRGKNPEGQLSSYAWRSIMLSGRFVQLITITTLVLRASISSQTAICTSCVAALILERRSIPLSQSVPLSALRSVNSGPRDLIHRIFRNGGYTRVLYLEVILLLLIALGNIALQFSSTILLSDLHEHLLVEFPKEVQPNLTIDGDVSVVVSKWMYPLEVIPLFGEISSGYAATPNSLGLSDTGLKRHVMLPFQKGRTTLRSYEGPAIVMSSRVACIPPEIDGEVGSAISTDRTLRLSGYMTGRILVETSIIRAGLAVQRSCNSTQCQSEIPFHCTVPSSLLNEIVTAYCTPSQTNQSTTSEWRLDNISTWIPETSIVLAFATNFNTEGWESLSNHTTKLHEHIIKQEWASYNFGNGRVINTTLCFFNANVMVSNVSMGTSKELVEPSLGYLVDPLDTVNIRNFLGVNPTIQGPSERDTLEVKNITDRSDHIFGAHNTSQIPTSQSTAHWIEYFLKFTSANETFAGCDICDANVVSSAREYHRVFLDIIQSTWRASVAIQCIYTMVAQSLHYQYLNFNTISTPVQVAQTVSTTIPVRYSGLIAVVALVIMSTACALAITALYLSHSHYAMLGNFWHAISQTASDLTADILSRSNQADDPEVSDFLKENDPPVRLMKSSENGHIKIAKVEPIPHEPLGSEKPRTTMQLMWARVKKWRGKPA